MIENIYIDKRPINDTKLSSDLRFEVAKIIGKPIFFALLIIISIVLNLPNFLKIFFGNLFELVLAVMIV